MALKCKVFGFDNHGVGDALPWDEAAKQINTFLADGKRKVNRITQSSSLNKTFITIWYTKTE